MLIAIDHGNKQIKTVHCPPMVSGLQRSLTRPFGNNVLEYQDEYYTLSARRMPYRKDKTEDERFFVLTLFAIANEVEAQGGYSEDLICVDLAIGLPPAHFGAQHKAFVAYFKRFDILQFLYHGKAFSIYIDNVMCFPQAYAAAVTLINQFVDSPRTLVLDIGGFTADYLMLKKGRADLSTCDSLDNGVILLYNRIESKVNAELDLLLDEGDVDSILRGEQNGYDGRVCALVEQQAQEFVDDLIATLRERMIDLRTGKTVFVGGGAILLRRQIESAARIGDPLFVEDINANAKGFAYLYERMSNGR